MCVVWDYSRCSNVPNDRNSAIKFSGRSASFKGAVHWPDFFRAGRIVGQRAKGQKSRKFQAIGYRANGLPWKRGKPRRQERRAANSGPTVEFYHSLSPHPYCPSCFVRGWWWEAEGQVNVTQTTCVSRLPPSLILSLSLFFSLFFSRIRSISRPSLQKKSRKRYGPDTLWEHMCVLDSWRASGRSIEGLRTEIIHWTPCVCLYVCKFFLRWSRMTFLPEIRSLYVYDII